MHHRFGSRGILQRCSLPHDLRRRGGGSRPPFVDEAKISRCTAHRDPIVVMERLEHPRAVGLDRVGPREPIRPVHPRRFVIPGIRPRSLEPPKLAIDLRGVCPCRESRPRRGFRHQRDPCSRSSGSRWLGDPTRSFRRQPGGIGRDGVSHELLKLFEHSSMYRSVLRIPLRRGGEFRDELRANLFDPMSLSSKGEGEDPRP